MSWTWGVIVCVVVVVYFQGVKRDVKLLDLVFAEIKEKLDALEELKELKRTLDEVLAEIKELRESL